MAKDKINYLTNTETKTLIEAIDHPRAKAIIISILKVGLMLSEIVELKEPDINWQMSELEIKGKRKRALELDNETFDIFAIWSKRKSKKDSNYFFTPLKRTDAKLGKRSIDKLIRKHAQKAGIKKKVNAQILRNTFAVNLCKTGLTTKEAMQILGLKNKDCARRYFKA